MKNLKQTEVKKEIIQEQKGKTTIITLGILLSYITIYLLDFWQKSTIISYDIPRHILSAIVTAVISIGVIMIIPFERIYAWVKEKELSPYSRDVPARENGFSVLLTLYVICGFSGVVVCKLLSANCGYLFSFAASLIALVIIIGSVSWIKNNVSLVCFNLLMLLFNGLLLLYLTTSFYVGLIYSVSLALTYCVSFLRSARNQKIRNVLFYLALGLIILFAVILGVGKTARLNAWLHPEDSTMGWERLLLQGHTLYVPGEQFDFYSRHPFVTMYTELGIVPVILCIVAFLTVTFLLVYSRKFLSGKRYDIMVGVYMLLAVTFVTTLLADFGLFPTTSLPLVSGSTIFIQAGLMIRVFKKR